MASPAAPLLSLRNLKTRFYTYEGVVRALEGVEFDIRKGETFGLVGETGCGKSVTALSILRLVPSPPGRIEEGEVLFFVPADKWAHMKALESEAFSAFKALKEEFTRGPSLTSADARLLKATEEALSSNPPRFDIRVLKKVANLHPEGFAADRKATVQRAATELIALKSPYDLLARSEEYMRKIRGNLVAMVFQEPMSALNPVIAAGDQIAENILLHQKEVLAAEVLQELEEQIPLLGRPFAEADVDPTTGLYRCGNCETEVSLGARSCPHCGSRFFGPPRPLTLARVSWVIYRFLYRRMKQDPSDVILKIASRVPFLRKYERLIYQAAMKRAVEMLREVRIPEPEKAADAYPFELSGGMAQRVMIAIALSCSPKLLIADEPTTAVDVTIQAQVLKLMKDLKARVGSSILLITHNLGVVAETCDRVGVMYAGVMAEIGPTRSVFKEPLHPYTKGLMESIPRITREDDRLQIIRGSVPNLITPPPGCRFHPRCPVALAHCGWSSAEVHSRLEPLLKEDGVPELRWETTNPQVLVARGPEVSENLAERIRGVVANHRADDVALLAVESVDTDGGTVRLRLVRQVPPPMLEPRPEQRVACYQYGGWPPG